MFYLCSIMTDPAAPISEPDDAVDPRLDATAGQVAVLGELAEIGLRLAGALERLALAQVAAAEMALAAGEAGAPAVPAPRVDLGLSFDRLSRAIRLTLMLETRIAEGEVARGAQAAREAEHAAWTEAQAEAVLEVVEKTLEADGQDDETIIERLRETRDYLESGDDDYDVLEHPLSRVIALICEEFGVEPDWSLWTDTDWAIEEAQDRPRGSPYARRGFGSNGADGPQDEDRDLAEPAGGSP